MSRNNPVRDTYCYPDTDTLLNKYDIQQESELAALERQITAVRIAERERKEPEKSGYDLKKLCLIHKHIFGDLYEWAGKIRTVDIAKGRSLFCRAGYIGDAAQDIFSKLQKDNYLQSLPKDQFIGKLADYMTDINVLHPFREGNGRTQRTFFKELAAAAGYSIDFDKANKEIAVTADIAAMNGNTEILKNMLSRIVSKNSDEREQPQKSGQISVSDGQFYMDKKHLLEAVSQKLDDYKQNNTLERLVKQLNSLLQDNGLEKGTYDISARYKAIESISEKIDRKGYTAPSQITDLMGIKVVCNNEKDVAAVKSVLDKCFTTQEVNNYYDQARPDGYKSLHLLSETQKENLVEFQIKDIVNELKQKYCHFKIYKNPKIAAEIKPEINKQMNQYLDSYYSVKKLTVADKLTTQDIQIFDKKLVEILSEEKTKQLASSQSRPSVEIVNGGIYHISDEYFQVVTDRNLMSNKENGASRPTAIVMQDERVKGLYWAVPLSSRIEKYKAEIEKSIAKRGFCNTIMVEKIQDRDSAILVQNMFPIIPKYIDHEHMASGAHLTLTYSIIQKVKKSVKHMLKMNDIKNINIPFTSLNIDKSIMLNELQKEQEMSRQNQMKQDKVMDENPSQTPNLNLLMAQVDSKINEYRQGIKELDDVKESLVQKQPKQSNSLIAQIDSKINEYRQGIKELENAKRSLVQNQPKQSLDRQLKQANQKKAEIEKNRPEGRENPPKNRNHEL